MPDKDNNSIFDAYYYAHDCGIPYERNEHWLDFFGAIAKRLVQDFSPKTMLDAGCAKGFLVECLRNEGVSAFGVDISEYAISNAHESIKDYCRVASISDTLDSMYDVIISIEVLEHMEKSESEVAIANLCNHTDKILFSSSPHDYGEVTHVNVQQPEVWARIFARYGFFRDLDYDASYITPWAVLFCRNSQRSDKLVFEYERKLWQVYEENLDVRRKNLELVDQLKQLDLTNSQLKEIESIKSELSKTGGLLEEANKRISELETELNDITDSEDWRLMQEVKRIRGVVG